MLYCKNENSTIVVIITIVVMALVMRTLKIIYNSVCKHDNDRNDDRGSGLMIVLVSMIMNVIMDQGVPSNNHYTIVIRIIMIMGNGDANMHNNTK